MRMFSNISGIVTIVACTVLVGVNAPADDKWQGAVQVMQGKPPTSATDHKWRGAVGVMYQKRVGVEVREEEEVRLIPDSEGTASDKQGKKQNSREPPPKHPDPSRRAKITENIIDPSMKSDVAHNQATGQRKTVEGMTKNNLDLMDRVRRENPVNEGFLIPMPQPR